MFLCVCVLFVCYDPNTRVVLVVNKSVNAGIDAVDATFDLTSFITGKQ